MKFKRGELARWKRVQEHEHRTLRHWQRCYRCSQPTCHRVKITTSSTPGWEWVNWCGCSGEDTDQLPRHVYDCGHCKYAWCCGPLCACVINLPKAPPARMRHVREMQARWRKNLKKKCPRG